MALTTSPQSPSTEAPAQHRAAAPRWVVHVVVARLTVLAAVLAAQLRPSDAYFRLHHVLVIVGSLTVVFVAAVAGVLHR